MDKVIKMCESQEVNMSEINEIQFLNQFNYNESESTSVGLNNNESNDTRVTKCPALCGIVPHFKSCIPHPACTFCGTQNIPHFKIYLEKSSHYMFFV